MQEKQYDRVDLIGRSSQREVRTRTRSLWSLFSGLAITTLIVLATGAIPPSLTRAAPFVFPIPSSSPLRNLPPGGLASSCSATPPPVSLGQQRLLASLVKQKTSGGMGLVKGVNGKTTFAVCIQYLANVSVQLRIHLGSCLKEQSVVVAVKQLTLDRNGVGFIFPPRLVLLPFGNGPLFFSVHDLSRKDPTTQQPLSVGCSQFIKG